MQIEARITQIANGWLVCFEDRGSRHAENPPYCFSDLGEVAKFVRSEKFKKSINNEPFVEKEKP